MDVLFFSGRTAMERFSAQLPRAPKARSCRAPTGSDQSQGRCVLKTNFIEMLCIRN